MTSNAKGLIASVLLVTVGLAMMLSAGFDVMSFGKLATLLFSGFMGMYFLSRNMQSAALLWCFWFGNLYGHIEHSDRDSAMTAWIAAGVSVLICYAFNFYFNRKEETNVTR